QLTIRTAGEDAAASLRSSATAGGESWAAWFDTGWAAEVVGGTFISEAGSGLACLAEAVVSAVESTPMEPRKRPGGCSVAAGLLVATGGVATDAGADGDCRSAAAGELADVVAGPPL